MKNKYLLKAPPDFFQACDVRFSDFKMEYAINSHLWALIKIIYDQNYKYNLTVRSTLNNIVQNFNPIQLAMSSSRHSDHARTMSERLGLLGLLP